MQQRLTLVADGKQEEIDVGGGSVEDDRDGADPGRWASDRDVIREESQEAMTALETVDSALEEG